MYILFSQFCILGGLWPQKVQDAKDKLRDRIDWVLQESPLEGMQPWASAVFAHSSYFQNIDMLMFLINAMDDQDQLG